MWRLRKADGKYAGTRQASALAFAEWLGVEGFLGAVFVRSDDGGVHALRPITMAYLSSKNLVDGLCGAGRGPRCAGDAQQGMFCVALLQSVAARLRLRHALIGS